MIQEIRRHKQTVVVIVAVFLLSVTAIIFTLKQPPREPSVQSSSTASSRVSVTVNEIHRVQEKSSSSSSPASAQAILLSSSVPNQQSYLPSASSPVDYNGGSSSSGSVNSSQEPVNQVKSIKAPAEVTLSVGESTGINISVFPEDAVNKAVNWSSDNPKIASVDKTGMVTAVAAGSCRITVFSDHDSKVQAFVSLTVKSE